MKWGVGMFGRKKIILMIIILFVAMAVTAAYAAELMFVNQPLEDVKRHVDRNLNMQSLLSEQAVLDARHKEAIRLYNESKKQTAIFRNQLDRLNHDRVRQLDMERQQRLVEEYMLQIEYYNVALLTRQLNLAQEELEVINKQILVEEEKLAQGDSTQLTVDTLRNNRRRVENEIVELNSRIKQGKDAVAARINTDAGIAPEPLFTIPSRVPYTGQYIFEEIKTRQKNNNLELSRLRAFIGFHDILISSLRNYVGETNPTYLLSVSERSIMQLDVEILMQRIDIYAKTQYYAYRQSIENYKTRHERKSILDSQLIILEAKYQSGEISELQYLIDRFAILSELNEVYTANVAKINAIARMNLIENGIRLEN